MKEEDLLTHSTVETWSKLIWLQNLSIKMPVDKENFYLSYYNVQYAVINFSEMKYSFHYNLIMYSHKVYINHTACV